jgi:predicted Rossmann fold nucleotide-binding protein DprA/Smf involved in DNA uptake
MPFNNTIVEATSSDFPTASRNGELIRFCSRVWAIGNLRLLETRLLAFFCSTRCPGNVILQIYDLVRVLRDTSVPVIGGFQSPVEKECLDLLLCGQQPIVACPARSIERMRLPAAWRTPLDEGRILVCSPYAALSRRPTAALAEQRNRFVAVLAHAVVVAHARSGSKSARLSAEMVASGKRVYTLDLPENAELMEHGVKGYTVPDLVCCFVGRTHSDEAS